MGLRGVLLALQDYLEERRARRYRDRSCRVCSEKDRQIAYLKEQLHMSHRDIDEMRRRADEIFERQSEMLNHYTGLRYAKVPGETNSDKEKKFEPIRQRSSIADRLRAAERSEAKPELVIQRNKEYQDRINTLMNPEIEILDNTEEKDAEVS